MESTGRFSFSAGAAARPAFRKRTRARNDYIIVVDAVGTDGNVLSLPLYSEEDNKTERVSRRGIRVSQAIYDRVCNDKLDDGILQENRSGGQRKSDLQPE